ncbi:MAG: zinc ribbon domain-containing protein [Gemmatimonadetes bacterium]|nr:zinc ribbon domain-containing protein [Gemmatimonadota bacterium]
MDELDRLFHHVVRAVAALGTDRVREPIPITELYQELVPYRQNRSALRFDTQQDYEAAMLRLLAGERGYARVEPAEAQQALAAEAGAAYPETGVFREFAAARVYLSPPPPTTTPAGGAAEAAGAAGAAAEESGAMEESCPYCDAELPKGRQLFYCPFCGGNLKGVRCPECRTELEVGWLYCVTCGRKMGGD